VPDDWIDSVFAVMALAPQHTFQVLTKRVERALATISSLAFRGLVSSYYDRLVRPEASPWDVEEMHSVLWPIPNVWLGVTAENQQRANERIPLLLQIPAAVRFVSVEPMLGSVGLARLFPSAYGMRNDRFQVICGAETGPGARPMHPEWARSLRDQCQAAGVPFFFKQWGEFQEGSNVVNGKYFKNHLKKIQLIKLFFCSLKNESSF
jgi:protein gp37